VTCRLSSKFCICHPCWRKPSKGQQGFTVVILCAKENAIRDNRKGTTDMQEFLGGKSKLGSSEETRVPCDKQEVWRNIVDQLYLLRRVRAFKDDSGLSKVHSRWSGRVNSSQCVSRTTFYMNSLRIGKLLLAWNGTPLLVFSSPKLSSFGIEKAWCMHAENRESSFERHMLQREWEGHITCRELFATRRKTLPTRRSPETLKCFYLLRSLKVCW